MVSDIAGEKNDGPAVRLVNPFQSFVYWESLVIQTNPSVGVSRWGKRHFEILGR